jgi:succinyl-CoA synthetase beta subunit
MKKYNLIYLGLFKEPAYKEEFLQHIHDILNVKLDANETYSTLFEKLQTSFKHDEAKLTAVNEWVELNKEDRDEFFLDAKITADKEFKYMAFDFQTLK